MVESAATRMKIPSHTECFRSLGALARRGYKLLEDFVRMSTHELSIPCDKTRNASDSIPASLFPICIDSILISTLEKRAARRLFRYPAGLCDIDQNLGVADVTRMLKVGTIEGIAKFIAVETPRKLLREPAVVSMRTLVEGETFGVH